MHYGYLPVILYLGYSMSEPKPALIKYALSRRGASADGADGGAQAHLPVGVSAECRECLWADRQNGMLGLECPGLWGVSRNEMEAWLVGLYNYHVATSLSPSHIFSPSLSLSPFSSVCLQLRHIECLSPCLRVSVSPAMCCCVSPFVSPRL